MSPSESSMPLIAFLLVTHARLQDNACAISHDSYVGSNLLCLVPTPSPCVPRIIMRIQFMTFEPERWTSEFKGGTRVSQTWLGPCHESESYICSALVRVTY